MDKNELVATIFVLAGILLVAYLLLTSNPPDQLANTMNGKLKDYNVPLDLVTCRPTPTGPLCTADANIQVPDTNGIRYTARADVLIVEDGNTLTIVKLTPPPETTMIREAEIPDEVREAIGKITLVFGDTMYCITNTATKLKCYIPTNQAPLGNATIKFAPLFEIQFEDNNVTSVLVYV